MKNIAKSLLRRYGYGMLPSYLLYDFQKEPRIRERYNKSKLPEGAEDYLQPNHPRLKELSTRYSLFNNKVTAPLVWTDDYVKPDDIKYFRGDNAYVWQLRGTNMNALGYTLATYYVKTIDTFGLLDKLKEDENFGIITFFIDNKIVSRDLLDSIIEIYFIEKHLKISSYNNLTILDIGAGYGRLADRTVNAFRNIRSYFCTDAIATSTFISEYYLAYRKSDNKTKVIPLDEIENTLETQKVDIAVNIHSFSECKITAINWWLSLLENNKVKYLMIVHNSGDQLLTNDHQDFQTIIENHGYKLTVKEPKYRDPIVQKYAIMPDYYYLFELQ
jgi:hypothetical protein